MNTEKGKGNKGLFIFLIIILMLLVLGFVFLGIRGVLNILKWLLIGLFILAIIGLLIYFIWFLFFKKEKYDVTYVNKKKLLDACKKGNPQTMKDLYISGDKGHSRVRWGKITGYCRISVLTRNLEVDKDGKPQYETKDGGKELKYQLEKIEQDVFSVTTARTWLGKLFSDEEVVRVSPDSHNELVGDVILYGFSLIPISEYWFLNDDFLDVRKIDYAILKEAERGIMFEMLRDSKAIVDKASGLDSRHNKEIEQKTMFEVPNFKK